MIEPGENEDVPLPRLEHPGRAQNRVMQAGADWLRRAAARAERLDPDIVVVEVGVEQRDIEILPFAGALAMEQGAGDRGQPVHTGGNVANREHRRVMRAALFAAQRSYARIGLTYEIVTRVVGEWALLTEGRD